MRDYLFYFFKKRSKEGIVLCDGSHKKAKGDYRRDVHAVIKKAS